MYPTLYSVLLNCNSRYFFNQSKSLFSLSPSWMTSFHQSLQEGHVHYRFTEDFLLLRRYVCAPPSCKDLVSCRARSRVSKYTPETFLLLPLTPFNSNRSNRPGFVRRLPLNLTWLLAVNNLNFRIRFCLLVFLRVEV